MMENGKMVTADGKGKIINKNWVFFSKNNSNIRNSIFNFNISLN